MVQCNRCDDRLEYEWYENHLGNWRLGTKLDVGNYRIHECKSQKETPKPNNKRNWRRFKCDVCGCYTVQNAMAVRENINTCLECKRQ